MNKLLHNNTLFTLTLLGIATALAFLFFSFVSENTANIALLYIIAQILIARYTNGYLHGLFFSASDKMEPSDRREEVVAVVSNVMINIPINVTG